MDELNEALKLSIPAPQRRVALQAFRRQMRRWGIALPDVPPLALSFGMGDFYEHGLVESWIANERQAGYCGKYLFLFGGQTCAKHFHKRKLETFFIVKGKVRMEYGGKTWVMRPGDVLRVDRSKAHRFTGIGPALILEISKPCLVNDNYFEDPRVPYGHPAGKKRG